MHRRTKLKSGDIIIYHYLNSYKIIKCLVRNCYHIPRFIVANPIEPNIKPHKIIKKTLHLLPHYKYIYKRGDCEFVKYYIKFYEVSIKI